MKYSEAYQTTRDIDWFFSSGPRCIHVASNGGKLPDFINDIQRLREEQANVAVLEDIKDEELLINWSYVDSRIRASLDRNDGFQDVQQLRESYLASFMTMARKGFYSYDRALDDNSRYILICGPELPSKVGLQLLEKDEEIVFDGEDFYSFRVEE